MDAYKYTSLESVNRPEVRVIENPGLVASGEADVM